VTLANIMILLSLNLAILNLLPIPALDGGRLLFVIIEFIRGKRVTPEKESLVHLVGLAILLAFMFVVAFVDIDRLASGQSFLH
jgi:regulator of sigma E protease